MYVFYVMLCVSQKGIIIVGVLWMTSFIMYETTQQLRTSILVDYLD